jgi:hypothetical protein
MIIFCKKIIKKFFYFFGLEILRIKKQMPINSDFSVVEASEEIKKIIRSCSKYSMTGELRMYVLSQAVKYIKNSNLKGDFVECGVWRGGNIILFQKLNLLYDLKRQIYAFDTFSGMSKPTQFDMSYNILAEEYLKMGPDLCYSSYEEFFKNVSKETTFENIKVIKGKVEDTLLEEMNLPENISILRLDTDWYESTKIELEILYKRLVKGGILILDDYGHWTGAKKAVDEYFGEDVWLHYVDYSCRYVIKK